MNTDFVPLSSLLESMKTPLFEGLDRDEVRRSQAAEPSSDQPQAPANKETSGSNRSKTENPPPPPKPAIERACSEPKVLLDRDGEKITRIRVLCSCGQSIVLDCQYPN